MVEVILRLGFLVFGAIIGFFAGLIMAVVTEAEKDLDSKDKDKHDDTELDE